VLDAAGVPGEIVCADLFAPPPHLLAQFDVVVSFGVVEHFDDTAACVAACARLVKPGGLMVTTCSAGSIPPSTPRMWRCGHLSSRRRTFGPGSRSKAAAI
jgi:SAM-dependent methyltransferase